MDEVWRKIFIKYINDYNAIVLLHKDELLDDEDYAMIEHTLLKDIIVTMKSEIED
jgi:hypothetical protein